jgi:site-specific recombinase XerD
MASKPPAIYDKHGNLILTGNTKSTLQDLGPRAQDDYVSFKTGFVKWLHERGREPARRRGYAETTIKATSSKMDQVFRWRWDDKGAYTIDLSPDDADRFIKHIDWDRNYTDGTIGSFVRALKRYFRYRNDIYDRNIDWDCDLKLSQSPANVRDYFKKAEFRKLYEAALEYGTVKHYNQCTPEERDRMKGVLASQFSISKEDVTNRHFEQANSWKIPALMGVSLDIGIRPIEVKRSKTWWFDPVLSGEPEMDIPAEEATKNDNNWRPALSPRTVEAVRRWFDERDAIEKYDGSDAVWLTKYGNPYETNSLNTVLDTILKNTDIKERGRDLSFYCIRHGVATVWANEVGIHHAKEQLRHNSVETTMGYVHSSREKRAEHLRGFW